jgi:hypothetical protein
VVGFTTGSRGEVPGKKENLLQEIVMVIIIIMYQISIGSAQDSYFICMILLYRKDKEKTQKYGSVVCSCT